ncbi:MAG: YdcF family protein [bacterium]|nr:YdcF family protein [bacterium]
MHHQLEKADCILVLGNNDLRVAERGAQLYLDGFAPYIVFSGTGFGHKHRKDMLATNWQKAEAEIFADVAIKMGVPKENIILEKNSTNTGENIIFTKKLLAEKQLYPKKIILVQKPYMERRAYATFKNFWPQTEVMVTSQQISFTDYPNKAITKDKLINIMVGDLQRIKIYPDKGFQIPQEIPNNVWDAYKKLSAVGYDLHLIR